jgi:hypothetical protein
MPPKYDYNFVKDYVSSHQDQLLSNSHQYDNAQSGLLILCYKCGNKFCQTFSQYKRSKEKGTKHQGCMYN